MPSARRKNSKRLKRLGKASYAGTTAYKQRIEDMNVSALRVRVALHGPHVPTMLVPRER